MAVNRAIYHITHADNLASIIQCDCLWSDARRAKRGFSSTNIGLSHIKARRLSRPVPVAERGMLGDYVPFNFCPRSVMLFVVSKGHENYSGGGEEIVHLVSDFDAVLASKRPWAFTDGHADVALAEYFDNVRDFNKVNWSVMPLTYWNEPVVKHQRQAEFLVHDWFPWTGVLEIGVRTSKVAERVKLLVQKASHRPAVVVRPDWYY